MSDQKTLTVDELVQAGIESKIPLKVIRAKLRSMGVRWKYSFRGTGTGLREQQRRMRQLGLCEEGCGSRAPRHRTPRICDTCLEKKWSE